VHSTEIEKLPVGRCWVPIKRRAPRIFAIQNSIIGNLLGTTLGGAISFCTSYFYWSRQSRQHQRSAAMQVATNLRHWINIVCERILETANHISSDGAGGHLYSDVPDFRFENNLDLVSSLNSKVAKNVFDLLQKKATLTSTVRSTSEYEGGDEAIDAFRGTAARLCIEAAAIYNVLAEIVKWPKDVLSAETHSWLEQEIARFQELQRDQAASTAEMLRSLEQK